MSIVDSTSCKSKESQSMLCAPAMVPQAQGFCCWTRKAQKQIYYYTSTFCSGEKGVKDNISNYGWKIR